MKHLFAYDAKMDPTLRTPHVGQHVSHAPVAVATNLNRNHVLQLQMWYAKNAASAPQAFGR